MPVHASRRKITVRDPVYGNVYLSGPEMDIFEHKYVQRLRRIKQLGFSEYVYPGATHTRLSHSLGVLDVASRVFDRLLPEGQSYVSEPRRQRMRIAVRMSALVHDLGHAAFSHSGEANMPPKRQVFPEVLSDLFERPALQGRADHEDYTSAFLLSDEFGAFLETVFARHDISRRDIVTILRGRDLWEERRFVEEGVNYLPLLHQIISSEIDADRMDYLLRDSLFCGVSYGHYDQDWLISNFVPLIKGDTAYLALQTKAVFSFEDFLLSRYHMFITVYLHNRSRSFGRMLQLFYKDEQMTLPSNLDEYYALDDITMQLRLRNSGNHWAANIVAASNYHRLLEINSYDTVQRTWPVDDIKAALDGDGIAWIEDRVTGRLSKYYGKKGIPEWPIYVVAEDSQFWRIEQYSPLFERFIKPIEFHRIFVRPDQSAAAQRIVQKYAKL